MSRIRNHKNVVIVPVVDPDGKFDGEVKTLANTAWPVFSNDAPVVYINWLAGDRQRPNSEELAVPIVVKEDIVLDEKVLVKAGTVFHGHWAWGSSVKKGVTIGLVSDVVADSGLASKAEDAQRFGRQMLPNCQYGSIVGDLKVKIVPPGTIVNGAPVADGFGYVRQGIVDLAAESKTARRLCQPDFGKDSFHVTQRVPWTAPIEAESKPLIEKRLNDYRNNRQDIEVVYGRESALLDKEPMLKKHPFFANRLARGAKEDAIRMATTIPMSATVSVAVPTTAKILALPNGKYIIYRFPIDAWGSIRAVVVDDDCRAEIERISKMGVVQYTLSSPEMFAKGQLGIAADEGLEGFDVVLCSKDIKMTTIGRVNMELKDAFLGFTMHTAPGHALGVNYELWERLGGDFDGDNIFAANCSSRPALYDAVSNFPDQDTKKLPKSNAKLNDENRINMVRNSMSNLIGFATNLVANTFSMRDRIHMAHELGFETETEMDKVLHFFVKVGTDLFKLDLEKLGTNLEDVEEQIACNMTTVVKFMGRPAPWISWKKDEWSFSHGIPQMYSQETAEWPDNQIVPTSFTGTVGQICRLTLHKIKDVLDTPIDVNPLRSFRAWAIKPEDDEVGPCVRLQMKFNNRIRSVSWTDPDDVADFNVWMAYQVDRWMKERKLATWQAANILWWVSHSSGSALAGASAVFHAFPDLVEEIVTKKPGLVAGKKALQTTMLGLAQNVENLTCKATVTSFDEVKAGKRVARKSVVLDNAGAMSGKYCVIPMEAETPDNGEYTVKISRRSPKSWFATFVL